VQTADRHSTSIQGTTKSVHAETIRVVDEQMRDLNAQMTSLDDFLARARSQNAAHHDEHVGSFAKLSGTIEDSYSTIRSHSKDTFSRVQSLESEMALSTGSAAESLKPLGENICRPLASLRQEISSTKFQEYQPTGSTPQKMVYEYPTNLPHTKSHSALINELNGGSSPSKSSSTGAVFADADTILGENRSPSRPPSSESLASRQALSMSLREVHPNVNGATTLGFDPQAKSAHTAHGFSASVGPGTLCAATLDNDNTLPLFKKSRTTRANFGKKAGSAPPAEGRENLPLALQIFENGGSGATGEVFAQSVSRRKSPRLH
jgi:kinesin family member 11